MPKILFIAAHRPDRSPSQRFRFEQYISYLKENGFDSECSFIISEQDDAVFYKPGSYFSKFRIFLKSFRHRLKDARKANQFDIVYVQREAFMTRSIRFEKKFKKSKAKLVFDFDDSIWLSNVSDANRKLNWLKDAEKTAKIIAISNMIFAGNQYLKDYASQFNQNIKIIPTTIDTEEYQRIPTENDKICIGWSGSITTIQHFEYALPFLIRIKEKYGDKVVFKVIGDANYRNESLGIKGIGWNKQDEIKELSSFDIGIMPLPDDEWAKGKCGLKGLQYMALEIPTIMSPVGVNSEIIDNGKNGFLASTVAEWEEKISELIEDKTLRMNMGKAARQTVIDQYSVIANREKYLQYFKEVINE
jgi:glycosyltransferase involved in cell wall biosynthesis